MESWEEELIEIEKRERKINDLLLFSLGLTWEDIEEVLDGCDLAGEMRLAHTPKGAEQGEFTERFTNVYVDQRTGCCEDDYYGNIYAEFAAGQWLVIPYTC